MFTYSRSGVRSPVLQKTHRVEEQIHGKSNEDYSFFFGIAWKFGEVYQLMCHPRHLTVIQNCEGLGLISAEGMGFLKGRSRDGYSNIYRAASPLVRLLEGEEKQISESHDVHFQWIPSHVNIFGNEQVDLLAKEGCNASPPISSTLTYSEHQSWVKFEILKECWTHPTITGTKANIQDPHSYLNVA
ncbi:hypothetical protein TNCV_3656251 [Trichonephila clavipes]|nr:hypothetical protein TNCV_3656251 [Trichonephila clavipes]